MYFVEVYYKAQKIHTIYHTIAATGDKKNKRDSLPYICNVVKHDALSNGCS